MSCVHLNILTFVVKCMPSSDCVETLLSVNEEETIEAIDEELTGPIAKLN